MKTRFYKKKLSATTTQQSETLPRLVELHILNAGQDNIFIEPDNDLDDDSVLVPAGMSVTLKADYQTLKYKTATSIATVYLYGTRHIKT